MAPRRENHLDNIFRDLGEFKIFNVLQILVLGLQSFPSANQLLSNVFICRDVPHQCAPASNDTLSSSLLSGLDEYQHHNLTISYQQCNIAVYYNNTLLKKEDCIYGMYYDLPIDTSAVSQFDLVCDHSYLAKLSQTLVIVGQGIGAFIFAMVSDRYGRKTALVTSNFGLLVSGLVIAYAPNYAVFAVFKCIAGAFQQGCVASYITILVEMLTTTHRRRATLISGLAWSVGAMTLPLSAYVFRHQSWRTLQMFLSLSSLPFLLQWWYGKESLRWMIANGKSKQVVDYIRQATKLNKTSFDRTMKTYEEACTTMQRHKDDERKSNKSSDDAAIRKLTMLDLLKVKRLLLNAVVMWLAWFTTALSFFAIYLMSSSLAGDRYLNFFLLTLMEVPNCFVLYFCLNRFGRKFSMGLMFFLLSVGLLLAGIFKSMEQNSVNSTLALICSCIAMAGASGSFALIFCYTPELFPTNLRNQALGVSSLIGRVGGMIAPFTGALADEAKWAPGVLIGGLAIIVCLLSIFFLPETRGRELPQSIGDVTGWYSKTSSSDGESSDECEDDHNIRFSKR